jgi:hypothetical protein
VAEVPKVTAMWRPFSETRLVRKMVPEGVPAPPADFPKEPQGDVPGNGGGGEGGGTSPPPEDLKKQIADLKKENARLKKLINDLSGVDQDDE